MSHKKMTVLEAIEYIEANDDKAFAFRGDDFIPKKKFRPSKYQGDDGRKNIQLPGVSGIGVSSMIDRGDIAASIEMARSYGSNVFLLQSEYHNTQNGEDYGEVIMTRHKIVAVIDADFGRSPSPDYPWQLTGHIPVKSEPEIEKSPKLPFEEWSLKAFKKVYPNEGIFASQYASYLKRNGYR